MGDLTRARTAAQTVALLGHPSREVGMEDPMGDPIPESPRRGSPPLRSGLDAQYPVGRIN